MSEARPPHPLEHLRTADLKPKSTLAVETSPAPSAETAPQGQEPSRGDTPRQLDTMQSQYTRAAGEIGESLKQTTTTSSTFHQFEELHEQLQSLGTQTHDALERLAASSSALTQLVEQKRERESVENPTAEQPQDNQPDEDIVQETLPPQQQDVENNLESEVAESNPDIHALSSLPQIRDSTNSFRATGAVTLGNFLGTIDYIVGAFAPNYVSLPLKNQEAHPITSTASLLRLIHSLTLTDKIYAKDAALIRENLSQIVSIALNEPSLHGTLIDALLNKYQHKNEEILFGKELLQEIFNQLNRSSDFDPQRSLFVDRLIQKCMQSTPTRFYKYREVDALVEDILSIGEEQFGDIQAFYQKMGIDNYQLNRHLFGDDKYNHRLRAYNMLSIIDLEKRDPGICQKLQKNFGVSFFYRYSQELLFTLDKEKDNNDLRRVLVVVAADDWNKAMSQNKSYRKLLRLRKHNILPMIFEVDSIDQIERLVNKTNPDILKSVFQVMFSAHGSYDGFNLGRMRINMFNAYELITIFDKLPNVKQIILDACSTGQKRKKGQNGKNIARTIRNLLGIDTVAPRPDAVLSMRLGKKGITYLARTGPGNGEVSLSVFPARLSRYKATDKETDIEYRGPVE